MSTKQCPQCSSAVPAQARFCGQCGRTFGVGLGVAGDPSTRMIPTTVDDATADPPATAPDAPPPGPGARVGIATSFGHALVVPVALPGFDVEPSTAPAPPPSALPTPRLDPVSSATMLGHADGGTGGPWPPDPASSATMIGHTEHADEGGTAGPKPLDLGQTVFDTAPYGAEAKPPSLRDPNVGHTLFQGGTAELKPSSSPILQAAPVVAAVPVVAAAVPVVAAAAPVAATAPGPYPVTKPSPIGHLPPELANMRPGDKTMLGMPASDVLPPSRREPPPQPLPPSMSTMVGVALPGIAPTRDPGPSHAPPPPPHMGTLVGVAAPGIAPIRPFGDDEARGQAPTSSRMPVPSSTVPLPPAPPPLVEEPLPEAPARERRRGVPATAVVGIVFGLVAIVGGAAALVALRSGGPLSAQPQLDELGKESLKIGCATCPDGTTISLGASTAKVQGGAVLLPLPAPLAIGDNDLEVKIDRPGTGRDETVKIHVPVAYRVKADLSTLSASPPAITVRAEATPDAVITVDGTPVTLDASGRGAHAIDVAAEVEGTSDESRAIDKRIQFTIKPRGAKQAENGQLVVRATVIPLHLDAPGLELYTDRPTAAIAGQTRPNGTITIDGRGVPLDPQGRFAVRAELPADGEKTLTIVANAPPLAPRTVRAKVVRVASLEAAARTLDARSPLPFDAFGADPQSKVGKLVVIEGEVVEARVSQGHTVMLVEEKKACTTGSCVVRVVHGDEVKAARGDNARIHGRLVGTVASGGKTLPDIEGSVVIARPGGKK